MESRINPSNLSSCFYFIFRDKMGASEAYNPPFGLHLTRHEKMSYLLSHTIVYNVTVALNIRLSQIFLDWRVSNFSIYLAAVDSFAPSLETSVVGCFFFQ